MQSVIRVEQLSKQYHLGAGPKGYRTLRETLANASKAVIGKFGRNGAAVASEPVRESRSFWALKNVSFDIKQGEVVGIIGRNGAGKSTLLKILSRIVEPTNGRARVLGRLGSLLEVGTGFHPELTGRENIYLNGSILGMTRREIARKFDEIVAFSEIEQFLDTPVKRYSSGMYVRLAFSVAAHLDPTILLIDEVLAVGDVAFQNKCLGKMNEAARNGRTICFVSHNMPAVLHLCSRAILLRGGRNVADGPASEVCEKYLLDERDAQPAYCDLTERVRPEPVGGGVQLAGGQLGSSLPGSPWGMSYGTPPEFVVRVRVLKPVSYVELGMSLKTSTSFEVASSLSCDSLTLEPKGVGEYEFRMRFPTLRLAPGKYFFGVGVRSDRGMEDYLPEACWFEVMPTVESAERKIHYRKGAVVPELNCQLTKLP